MALQMLLPLKKAKQESIYMYYHPLNLSMYVSLSNLSQIPDENNFFFLTAPLTLIIPASQSHVFLLTH